MQNLQQCAKINDLYFPCDNCKYEEIINLPLNHPELKSLKLKAHSTLSPIVDVASRLTKLVTLEVTRCKHSNNYEELNILQGYEVLSVARNCKSLRKLALRNCTIGEHPDMIASAILTIQYLSHLDLSSSHIDAEILKAIVVKNQLKELNLCRAVISTDTFDSSVKSFNLVNLQRLNLTGTLVTTLWLEQVKNICLQLQILEVSDSNYIHLTEVDETCLWN